MATEKCKIPQGHLKQSTNSVILVDFLMKKGNFMKVNYLERKNKEHKAEHQPLVWNVAQQHLQRGQVGRTLCCFSTELC